MTTAQRKRRSAYGCDDFTARLAAREAALGLADAPIIQELHKSIPPQSDNTAPADTAPDAAPPMGDMGHDRWGNAYLSKPGLLGQYVTRGWYDGRVVYVCGDTGKRDMSERTHWRQWKRDARDDGQGWMCPICWPQCASW
jgi:hypothetical protein